MVKNIGIDLGTSNVLINLYGKGIVLNEPAVVAMDTRTQEIIAVGKQAYDMLGRTPESIEVIRPLKGGVIADFDVAEAMLLLFLERVHRRSFFSKPNVLICTPASVSEIERLALIEAVERVGAGHIYIEEEAKVAGVGAGIDLLGTTARMVIDIGGGTSDVAVIVSGEVLVSESIKLAGDDFDAAIVQYFKDQFHVLIGERSAETVKKTVSTAKLLSEAELVTYDIKGRDLLTGLPKSVNVTANQLYVALHPYFERIARVAKRILETLPPEVAADVIENGVILTGGGALIYHMDTYLTEYLHVSVLRDEQPLNCVAIGTGLLLDMILSGKLERTNPTWQQRWKRRWLRFKRRLMG